jgi:hypothetical protein
LALDKQTTNPNGFLEPGGLEGHYGSSTTAASKPPSPPHNGGSAVKSLGHLSYFLPASPSDVSLAQTAPSDVSLAQTAPSDVSLEQTTPPDVRTHRLHRRRHDRDTTGGIVFSSRDIAGIAPQLKNMG